MIKAIFTYFFTLFLIVSIFLKALFYYHRKRWRRANLESKNYSLLGDQTGGAAAATAAGEKKNDDKPSTTTRTKTTGGSDASVAGGGAAASTPLQETTTTTNEQRNRNQQQEEEEEEQNNNRNEEENEAEKEKKEETLSEEFCLREFHYGRAAVVVCGDIARSPRMQYHAVSLCEYFKKVHIIGADMSNRCCDALEKHKRTGTAVFNLVKEDESNQQKSTKQQQQQQSSWASRVINRVLGLVLTYYSAVRQICAEPDLMLIVVQTPPVIPLLPVLFVAVLYANVIRALQMIMFDLAGGNEFNGMKYVLPPIRVVFDIHNYGWTILKAEKRPRIFVFLYWLVEWLFCCTGWMCDGRMTVAQALGVHLKSYNASFVKNNTFVGEQPSFSLSQMVPEFLLPSAPVAVMPDAAPDFFKPNTRKEFFESVLLSGNEPKIEFGGLPDKTIPAWIRNEQQQQQQHSTNNSKKIASLFIAASTSWTPDDDYTVVVDALKILDENYINEKLSQNNNNRNENSNSNNLEINVWLFVSGKGPSRHIFEEQIIAAELKHVRITTGYLQSFNDYALLLGAADIGLCLHHSSSGVDLPMKAVDMLGAGLPVCALRYLPALPELVTGEVGWLFSDAAQLATIWSDLIEFKLTNGESDKDKMAREMQKRSNNNNNAGGGAASSSSSSSSSKLSNFSSDIAKKKEKVIAGRMFWRNGWRERVLPSLIKVVFP